MVLTGHRHGNQAYCWASLKLMGMRLEPSASIGMVSQPNEVKLLQHLP